MRMPSFVSGIAGVAFSIIFVIIFISFLFDFRYCRHILSTLPICRILPAAKHRQNAKAPLPAKTAGLKNKERNEHDGESVLCIEEILLPHLLYILYQIFRQAQIFVGFFFRWQQMTTIGIQCSIRQPVQYSSAGIRNPVFRQQLFAARRLFIQANEASRQPLYYLTGQYSPARLIFFTGQISDFRLRTTLLSRRLRRRQPRFRSHKQINKRTFQKNSQKNFKNNSKSNPKEPK